MNIIKAATNNNNNDDMILLNDLKKKINLELKNAILTDYLIYEFKIKYAKNKYEISKNKLKKLKTDDIQNIILKTYTLYLKELHYLKYQKLLASFDNNINDILKKLILIFNNL
jgi:hypothetical protein